MSNMFTDPTRGSQQLAAARTGRFERDTQREQDGFPRNRRTSHHRLHESEAGAAAATPIDDAEIY